MHLNHCVALPATPMARAIRAVFIVMPMLSPLAVHAAAAADATMPTITVTGQAEQGMQVTSSASNKFTAPLVDTPRSVTVIPAALLKETQAASLSDALRTVPGISFKGGDAFGAPGGDHPSMRGFDSSSSLFIDGMRSAGAQSRETFDIEQIEVVKGPSSVYTGRGSVGGSINIISKTAKADDFKNAGVGVGSDGYLRGTLDANRQLGGNAAGRLNLMWHEANMPGRNAVDYSRWGIAPSVTFGLGGPTQVILSYYHMQSHDMPDYAVPYARAGGKPLDVPRSRFFGLTGRDFIKNTADIAQGEVRHDLGGSWKLRNVTQVAKTSLDYIATNPQWSGNSGDILLLEAKSGIFDMKSFTNQTELTGKLLLGGMQHSVTTGLELSRENSLFNLPDGGLMIYLGAVAFTIGNLSMSFLVPALAGYIAFGIADRPGIAPGFTAGAIAVFMGAGFLGGLVGGILAGLAAYWIGSWKVPRWLRGLMPVVIIPLLGSIIASGAMLLFLGAPIAALSNGLNSWLTGMTGTSAVILGMILGLMMCFDLGGPVNKVAYAFAVAGLGTGTALNQAPWEIMATVMAAGMVPPLALALATVLDKKRFSLAERENGKAAWLLGASFISEGAIPFAAADPLRVIPATMVGGAITGAMTMGFHVTSQAPHGGIFVFFAIGNVGMFILSIVVGTIVSALGVVALKRWAVRKPVDSLATAQPASQGN